MSIIIVANPKNALSEDRGTFMRLITGVFGVGKTSFSCVTLDAVDNDVHQRPKMVICSSRCLFRIFGRKHCRTSRSYRKRSLGPKPPFRAERTFSQARFDHVGGFLPGI